MLDMDVIERASKACGGMAKLAELMGESVQTVSNWRVRGIPVLKCAQLEAATAGAVTCEELRSDVQWRRIPDKSWPWHKAGRPFLDVTAVAA